MLKIESLSYWIGDKKILSRIDLSLSCGLHILSGKTGSGKTTILRCIARILRPDEGAIYLNGEKLSICNEMIGFMPHRPVIFKNLTVRDNINFWLDFYRIENRSESFDLCDVFDISEHLNSVCRQLSRGQAQKLSFIRSLMGRPSVLILDEPSTGLDDDSEVKIYRYLMDSYAKNSIVVFSTHQPEKVEKYAASRILLENGGTRQVLIKKVGDRKIA